MKSSQKRPHLYTGIILLPIFLLLFFYSVYRHVRTPNLTWGLSPYLFPALLGILGAALAATDFFKNKANQTKESKPQSSSNSILIFGGFLFLCLVFPILMKAVGFQICASLFLFLSCCLLRGKIDARILLPCVLFSLFIYYFFSVLLHVRLP